MFARCKRNVFKTKTLGGVVVMFLGRQTPLTAEGRSDRGQHPHSHHGLVSDLI